MKLYKYLFFILLALDTIGVHAEVAARRLSEEESRRYVFAHYMVCCPAAGPDADIADFLTEIRSAQEKGIDGFALNSGGWNSSEPIYKIRTVKMYSAAEMLGTDFKLFVSADGKAQEEIDDIFQTVQDLPNQFRINDRPVLSTFGGEGEGGLNGERLIVEAHRLGAYFVPYFYPRPVQEEIPRRESIEKLGRQFSSAEGFFYFGAAGYGEDISKANSSFADVWRARSKIFMASVTPYYAGRGKNFRVFETNGFEAMAREWEAAIASSASWVQIVTWNDWAESTYVAPFSENKPDEGDFRLPNYRMPQHVAYLDASQFYIDWFKRGRRPKIEKDRLFYFYRVHPKSLNRGGGNGFPSGYDRLRDNIFVSAFLKSSAILRIHSGSLFREVNLPSGVSHVRAPLGVGRQRFLLIRSGVKVIDKIGEKIITRPVTGDAFNYFSGQADVR